MDIIVHILAGDEALMPHTTIPTMAEVEQIASLEDATLRNLRITQCYHELALGMAPRTPGSANWCTFATWASKQAGQTIRKQDMARTLEDLLGSQAAAERAAQRLAAAAQRLGADTRTDQILSFIIKVLDPQAAFTRSSQAVARGNLKVFAEIGCEFARFYHELLDDTVYDADKIARFCEALRPGEPPEGQAYLRRAFQHYYQALFERNEKARAELMLLANIEIGFHEQTRLQPEINEALAAPVLSPQAFTSNLLKALRPEWGQLAGPIWAILRLLGRLAELDEAVETYLKAAQRQAQHLVTEAMMTIEVPVHLRLKLGEDLPVSFPPLLAHITDPELGALLAQVDPSPDSTLDSGAAYWGDLPDRLHFIVDLFRCFHQAAALFEPPFTAEQVAAMKAGQLPQGRL
jgi:hypothetical protein